MSTAKLIILEEVAVTVVIFSTRSNQLMITFGVLIVLLGKRSSMLARCLNADILTAHNVRVLDYNIHFEQDRYLSGLKGIATATGN